MADATTEASPSGWADAVAAADLERRVVRLEEAVEAIVHTSALEDRVVERVQQRLAEKERSESADTAVAHANETAVPHAHPADTAVPRASTADTAVPRASTADTAVPHLGIIREMGRELRLFFQMLRDPRFAVSWSAKLFPILAILYITVWPLLSGDWLGPFSKPLWLYPLDLLIAYIALKIIGRDLRRYEWHLAWRRP